MKRFEKRSAAGKPRVSGTKTVGMALTIGAALVGSTCRTASADYIQRTESTLLGTAEVAPALEANAPGPAYVSSRDGTGTSRAVWVWHPLTENDPAPALVVDHTFQCVPDVAARRTGPAGYAGARNYFQGFAELLESLTVGPTADPSDTKHIDPSTRFQRKTCYPEQRDVDGDGQLESVIWDERPLLVHAQVYATIYGYGDPRGGPSSAYAKAAGKVKSISFQRYYP